MYNMLLYTVLSCFIMAMALARLARRLPTALADDAAAIASQVLGRGSTARSRGMAASALPAQILVSAVARHREGAARDITKVIFEAGASIAATKKVMLEDNFALLLAVHTTKEPLPLVEHLGSEAVAKKLGFPVAARLLDGSASSPVVHSNDVQTRRLKLSCPQKPGIVLAVTELLKDFKCTVVSMEADTVARGQEIW